ncbi:hypothetical protein GCM10023205_09570 [Yinghuangia aomiensis]|uniref:Uncharacterized protein n=1 Tax=Yinghuangia aomiensis TaxID=676205 RepID=A0ABP9GUX7_9ACTN
MVGGDAVGDQGRDDGVGGQGQVVAVLFEAADGEYREPRPGGAEVGGGGAGEREIHGAKIAERRRRPRQPRPLWPRRT